MTNLQALTIEAIAGWFPSEEALAGYARKWESYVEPLARGEMIDVSETFSSGDQTSSEIYMKDGVVWCRSRGRHHWMNYDGPAEGCWIHRTGVRARQYALAYRYQYDPTSEVWGFTSPEDRPYLRDWLLDQGRDKDAEWLASVSDSDVCLGWAGIITKLSG